MAQYGITYRCGHTATIQIYGTNVHGERKKKAAWYGTVDCPACRAARARREHDGLPALKGSDRQVAWADDIRGKYMPKYTRERREWAEHGATAEQLAQVDKVLAWLKDQTSAAWWIDNGLSSSTALRAAAKAVNGRDA